MSNLIAEPSALLAAFPYSLSRDSNKEKLADAIANELVQTISKTESVEIFPRVDELPEEVLDILAYDLKVDWYEPEADIRYKRQAIKECMLVHKYKGTKYAVETALRSMYNSAEVKEWFEYGGEPFHFTVKVYGSTSSGLRTLYLKIQYAKNLRSVLDNVEFELVPDEAVETFFGAQIASIQKRIGAKLVDMSEDIYTIGNGFFIGAKANKMFKSISALLKIDNLPFFSTGTSILYGARTTSVSKKVRADLTCS